MPTYLDALNKTLSIGTIFLQVVIVLLIINLIFFRKTNNKLLLFFKRYTFPLGFLAGLVSIVTSLFYSELVGFPPCELCWVQRMFLYPQMILFGLGMYKKDKSIVDYSLIFAILGSLTSIYHIYIENGGSSGLDCAVVDPTKINEVSCATRYVYEFGYITIPVMCLTLSLFIIALILNYKYITKNQIN